MQTYKAIGLMSGTSLDGVDAVACEFRLENEKWSYRIHAATTYPYPEEWSHRLSGLHESSAVIFARTNVEYGHFLGRLARKFMEETGFSPQLIASHGHTIFHRPSEGYTCQIGSGSAIAAETGLMVASDFRSLDVALGGQGAPLVPIGDRLLFGNYDACLNLGGFANISLESEGERIAFDICPVNFVLNFLARRIGMPFDKDGQSARAGVMDEALLAKLNSLDYYTTSYPKSLGREWVETNILPLLVESAGSSESLLRTFCEHIAIQVQKALPWSLPRRILITGGGAYNDFLLERFQALSRHQWILPEKEIIEFKEALIFAFLGILRMMGNINVLKSVTGSNVDHSGGSVYII